MTDLKRNDYLVDIDDGDLYRIVKKGISPNHYIIRHVKTGVVDRSTEYYVGWNGSLREALPSEINATPDAE